MKGKERKIMRTLVNGNKQAQISNIVNNEFQEVKIKEIEMYQLVAQTI